MKNLSLYLTLIFLLSIYSISAQFNNRFSVGFKSGATYSKISGIHETIYPEDFWDRDDYTFEGKGRFGYVGAIFINYKSEAVQPLFAVQSELGFRMGGEKMEYIQPAGIDEEDEPYDALNFTMDFRYNYLDFALLGKIYPFAKVRNSSLAGLNFGLGSQVSFNLAPDKIFYESDYNGSDTTFADVNVQEDLRLSIKGNTDVLALVNLGYEFPMGLGIDLRYGVGFVDNIETIFNFNDWINNTNNQSQMAQLSLSYVVE